jgi:hypothetical protein
MPRIPRPGSAPAQSPGKFGAELAAPMADALVRDHHTTVGEDELGIPQAEAERVIQPHCMSDDLARKPMAAILRRLSAHSGSLPRPPSIRQSRLTWQCHSRTGYLAVSSLECRKHIAQSCGNGSSWYGPCFPSRASFWSCLSVLDQDFAPSGASAAARSRCRARRTGCC